MASSVLVANDQAPDLGVDASLLFDLIGAQVDPMMPWNGGSEYVKALFRALDLNVGLTHTHVLLSRHGILESAFESYMREKLPAERIHFIEDWPVLADLVASIGAKKVFFGILQRFAHRREFFSKPASHVEVYAGLPDIVEFEVEPKLASILYERCQTWRDWLWVARYSLFYPLLSKRIAKERQGATRALVNAVQNGFDSKFVTLSEYSKYSISRFLHVDLDKVLVFWPPPSQNQRRLRDLPLQSAPSASADVTFSMLGADRWSKNLDVVLKAGSILDAMGMKFRIVAIGNFQHRLVRYRFKGLNWLDIRGHLAPQDVESLVRSSKALLFPSICEGFGYPPIEAMLQGKLVIASASTSIPEIAGAPALFFSSQSSEMLAFQMLSVIMNADTDELRKTSRERALDVLARQISDETTLVKLLAPVRG